MEAADPKNGSAVLGCLVSYKWHSEARRFDTAPLMTASLSWDDSSSTAGHISHLDDDEYMSEMQSSIRVNISSRRKHNCTASFTFLPGMMHNT